MNECTYVHIMESWYVFVYVYIETRLQVITATNGTYYRCDTFVRAHLRMECTQGFVHVCVHRELMSLR